MRRLAIVVVGTCLLIALGLWRFYPSGDGTGGAALSAGSAGGALPGQAAPAVPAAAVQRAPALDEVTYVIACFSDGVAIPAADVWLSPERGRVLPPGSCRHLGCADTQGVLSVGMKYQRGLADACGAEHVLVAARGFVAQILPFEPDRRVCEVKLRRSHAITVECKSRDGVPVVGAHIYIGDDVFPCAPSFLESVNGSIDCGGRLGGICHGVSDASGVARLEVPGGVALVAWAVHPYFVARSPEWGGEAHVYASEAGSRYVCLFDPVMAAMARIQKSGVVQSSIFAVDNGIVEPAGLRQWLTSRKKLLSDAWSSETTIAVVSLGVPNERVPRGPWSAKVGYTGDGKVWHGVDIPYQSFEAALATGGASIQHDLPPVSRGWWEVCVQDARGQRVDGLPLILYMRNDAAGVPIRRRALSGQKVELFPGEWVAILDDAVGVRQIGECSARIDADEDAQDAMVLEALVSEVVLDVEDRASQTSVAVTIRKDGARLTGYVGAADAVPRVWLPDGDYELRYRISGRETKSVPFSVVSMQSSSGRPQTIMLR